MSVELKALYVCRYHARDDEDDKSGRDKDDSRDPKDRDNNGKPKR